MAPPSSKPSSKKTGAKIEQLASESAPLLATDGPVLAENYETLPNSGTGVGSGTSPGMIFYISTSWVLFLEGLSGMSGLAVSYFYKNTLKVDPATLTTVSSLTSLPWTCKPIYGFISDAFPIFGYRRKPYIFLAGLAGCISWVLMWCAVDGVWAGFTCMLIGSTAIAVANVISEAMVVERSKGESQEFASHLQSVVWGACSVGSLIASFLSGWILKFMTDRQVCPLCPEPPGAPSLNNIATSPAGAGGTPARPSGASNSEAPALAAGGPARAAGVPAVLPLPADARLPRLHLAGQARRRPRLHRGRAQASAARAAPPASRRFPSASLFESLSPSQLPQNLPFSISVLSLLSLASLI